MFIYKGYKLYVYKGYVHMKIYYKELAHMIMEAEKSRDLPSASGNPGKSVVSSQPKSKCQGWESQTECWGPMSQLRQQAERVRSPLLRLVVFRSTMEWMMSTHTEEGHLLKRLYSLA